MGAGSNGSVVGELLKLSFKVNIKGQERIAALLPLQEHWLPLSNLDLLLPPLDVGVFFCYKKQQQQQDDGYDFDAKVGHLKVSLAQALVTYYPFAGEVVANTAGEPELLCNNRGVDFIVAYADVELGDLQLHNPDETVEKKLVPQKKGGVLCVQVTELKCGGMVLACTFDHRISDAYSANMFLLAWSQMASTLDDHDHDHIKKPTKSLVALPSFRRSLLSPRHPGSANNPSLDRLYAPLSGPPPPSTTPLINRIYSISAENIEQMQVDKRTKLESFSAYLWQVIGKAAKKRRQVKVCRMGVVVNGRTRLQTDNQVMDNYFGNVLTIPYGSMDVEELEESELSDIANAVHEFVSEATNEEHFRGLIDWVEANRPKPAAARIYLDGDEGGVAFVVSSGRVFPVREVELGWGRPVFGSYHFPWGGSAGYVMPMPSASRAGDWVVYMHLAKDLVEILEEEAGHVFCPLTPEYMLPA